MLSARRAARAGLNRPSSEVSSVPDWIWGAEVRPRRWILDHGGSVEGRCEAALQWRQERDAWLREHGLVAQGMAGVNYEEFKRIEREETHRVLRHSPRPYGDARSEEWS